MNQFTKRFVTIVVLLSLLGIGMSTYLLEHHHAEAGSGCDINATVSCSLVNTSSYAELLNVPVAALGILWFIFLIIGTLKTNKDKDLFPLLQLWVTIGLIFIIYLIIGEILLRAICPFCTVVHVITLIIFIMFTKKWNKEQKLSIALKKSRRWIIAVILLHLLLLLIYNLI